MNTDITGREPDGHASNGALLYLIKCKDCPNTILVRKGSLTRLTNKKESYRCKVCSIQFYRVYKTDGEREAAEQKRIKNKELNRRINFKPKLKVILRDIKKRKWESTLTLQDLQNLWDKQNGLCAITDLSMLLRAIPEGHKNDPYSPSIDRIDSSKGYIIGNIRFVCWQVNWMKGYRTDEDLLFWSKAIIKGLT